MAQGGSLLSFVIISDTHYTKILLLIKIKINLVYILIGWCENYNNKKISRVDP